MKGLEFSLRNMSTSTNKCDEDDLERSREPKNEESLRNKLRGEEGKRDMFALASSYPTNRGNNIMKEPFTSRRRCKPKLVSAQAVLSSRLDADSIEEEPVMTVENVPDLEPSAVLDCSNTNATNSRKPTAEVRQEGSETTKEKNTDGKYSLTETVEVSRKSMWRAGHRERYRGKRRERLGGSVEDLTLENQAMEGEMNRGIRWRHTQKHWGSKERRDEESEKEDGPGEREGMQGSMEGDSEARGTMSHHVFSRVFAHSFASTSSSSSSSFNCSSAESDEVFSEGEEMTKRKDVRRCRSWRTFLTMMQWSKRRQGSWIQLAGHQGIDLYRHLKDRWNHHLGYQKGFSVQCHRRSHLDSLKNLSVAGNIQLGEGGEVLKRFNEVEDSCLQALMSDPLRGFVPQYYGQISRNGECYIRLEDLLSGLKQPVIMDCKMGIRTYLEEEIVKARTKASLRTDMYQKMMKVDPTVPTEEEHERKGVTKLRYMQWRDCTSSTSTLGFRVEGIMMENGVVLRDFNKTRTKAQVTETVLLFTKRQVHILEAYHSRLEALKQRLKESAFFSSHEVIGSSLLFVHDHTGKANIWMIDFGKTIPTPENIWLKHSVPWVEGNHEDGYLIGLDSLISLLCEAIKEAMAEKIEGQNPQTDHSKRDKLNQPQPELHKPLSDLLKEATNTSHLD
ncbi:hypothetical protein NFI96_012161 [Prochilodus magdalenae]|nr:hypothetical protein NFI96_012161 [Prochilodus magdalenae]